MDDLLDVFQETFTVASDPLDSSRFIPTHSALYKVKRDGYGDQEARRRKALLEQAQRRKDFVDHSRRIAEGQPVEEDEDEMEEGGYDEIDGTSARRKHSAPYRNQLMLSEWLVEVPPDFHDSWYVVVCPVAKRCLVVAARGVTTSYSRNGHFMNSFPSHLPGGCRKRAPKRTEYSILDCFYDSQASTYYILDLMCWNGHPIYDSETEFRFFWLRSKLSEFESDLCLQSETNPFKFVPLVPQDCSSETLSRILGSSSSQPVDGLLFFHKKSHYCLGRTPLALWLKPRMVPEVLGLPVSQEFLDSCPVMESSSRKMETEKEGKGSKMEVERKGKSKGGKENREMETEGGRKECLSVQRMEEQYMSNES